MRNVVAGFGFRQRATIADFHAALDAALTDADVAPDAVAEIAIPRVKRSAIVEAFAQRRGLMLVSLSEMDLHAAGDRCLTQSARSVGALGVPSVAEAAALAAAGEGARLIRPRIKTAAVTCALARRVQP
ncbi:MULTISPECIES: cobalamin biosynthesis protein [unclassified Chelatococcus]|uniref:cobalamin biosynthesis protein n=2 Tax=Chelatococcus TaxID=28209 RepID=UPI001BCD7ACB|nr:cobalamin biosynthesis protein [Chelatococcus sp.]MBS7741731.1 cobalamin biosynthesis protein [Chelatococcus sp. HY11]CAH1664648.1 Cobalt-precorrin 5A hydrolase [Hyphomicrobiales bacterium]MBX3544250.1 cobalamin biosynthesis protein [Chelatococcus sp.]MCO5079428.1 cobalamin biosynthesis protein [Chelatococcus sp.]CAH1681709.1 Cobalt-precorrin 5A hydrolase [Hyphomicrobiales bacterium]